MEGLVVLFARVYLKKSVCRFPDMVAKSTSVSRVGGACAGRPGESPGNPVWSSPQITHSVLGCGDSSADKMADILLPSFLLAIEFLPSWHAFATLNVPQLWNTLSPAKFYKDVDQLIWLCSFVKQILQPGAPSAPR